MEWFKINVEGVEKFMEQQNCLYASSTASSLRPSKRFLISLACGPDVKRFKVEVEGKETVAFSDLKAAVEYFNKH